MNHLNKFSIVILLIVVASKSLFSQEQLSALTSNSLLFNQSQKENSNQRSAVLNLPFYDDFSNEGVYPDQNKWTDRDVFVNRTFPVDPVTIGVATFDGLDEHGRPYDTLNFFTWGGADTLTSQPIDLSGNQISDSVYISFYYQPQGRGDRPDAGSTVMPGDSLVLEFLTQTGTWVEQWGITGQALHPFVQVLIPVKSNSYFYSQFQFRFRNYATLSGNNDHWHLDYVRVDAGRNMNDTSLNDVSALYNATSLLSNFQSMPWNQYVGFESTEAASTHSILARNNFNAFKNFNHQFEAYEINSPGVILGSSVSSSFNFSPLSEQFLNYNSFNFSSATPTNNEVTIVNKYTYNVTADINPDNDTIFHYQHFQNFEAYDDGSAELAYGVLGVGAKLALEFHLNVPDTLQAVAIHFAHLNADVSGKLFSIMVWKSLGPDSILYEHDFLRPTYVDTLNGFYYYRLSTPIFLNAGTFYIGWLQTYQDMLNVGFDMNDNSSSHLFYNVNGTWTGSTLSGAVMIRPMLGNPIPFGVGIPTLNQNNGVAIYPNPTHDDLFVNGNLSNNSHYQIFDLAGQLKLEGNIASNEIEVSKLLPGMFVLKITDAATSNSYFKKFIKQ